MKASVIRKSHFNAAHRLHNPKWDAEKNAQFFGKCNNPNFHGHNYEFEVKLTGDVDPETGYLFDLKILNELMERYVVQKLDHKNLNLDVEEFQSLNPTAEHIAYVIHTLLRPHIDTCYSLQITLWETPRNYVQYPA